MGRALRVSLAPPADSGEVLDTWVAQIKAALAIGEQLQAANNSTNPEPEPVDVIEDALDVVADAAEPEPQPDEVR